ncbi:alanine racemase [Microbacterium marinilacus]|uniref:Alanine racemase n=1 Tax=Microbacterium marinilacus TaxID=415209 RepID=A0ABP7BHA6_9MICO|nr:alanine racemase [Microbacterium marinilacus]MBY0688450.1 alanine racemase [Microbacterium marinilacus]
MTGADDVTGTAADAAASAGRPVELRISRSRLAANLAAARARLVPAELMVVVKDDAYAHGVEAVTAIAVEEGVRWLGAIDPRSAGRAKAVAGDRARVFCWLTLSADETRSALAEGLELGVGDAGYLERVGAAAESPAVVHLKIDTGLHRNGVRPEDWPGFVARAAQLERQGRIRVAGIWSHIAEASDAEDDASRAVFDAAVQVARDAGLTPEVRHLAASAAGWARPEFRYDIVRLGAFSYGIRSADGPEIDGIAPVATLIARVTALGHEAVEIGIGSLDGLPSTLGGRVHVGTPAGPRRLDGVGLVTSRVETWPGAAIGDEVAVFGPGTMGEASATTLGEAIGTVGEEPVLRVSPLVPRVVTD